MLDAIQTPSVREIIHSCGYAAAALTIIPIPGSEIIGVMPLHVGMVVAIADEHGVRLTSEGASELILHIGAAVGVSLVGSRIATTAAKIFLPGLGGLVSAPFMFASTLAIGAVADAWFACDGRLNERQMRDVYNRTKRRAGSEFDPAKARSADAQKAATQAARGETEEQVPEVAPAADKTPRERLERLKTLLEGGLIDAAEYDQLRAHILNEL